MLIRRHREIAALLEMWQLLENIEFVGILESNAQQDYRTIKTRTQGNSAIPFTHTSS